MRGRLVARTAEAHTSGEDGVSVHSTHKHQPQGRRLQDLRRHTERLTNCSPPAGLLLKSKALHRPASGGLRACEPRGQYGVMRMACNSCNSSGINENMIKAAEGLEQAIPENHTPALRQDSLRTQEAGEAGGTVQSR